MSDRLGKNLVKNSLITICSCRSQERSPHVHDTVVYSGRNVTNIFYW